MDQQQIDLNPFYKIPNAKLSDDELALLFTKANQQDEASVNKLVSYYSPIVESMILNFQPKNIPAKYTFIRRRAPALLPPCYYSSNLTTAKDDT